MREKQVDPLAGEVVVLPGKRSRLTPMQRRFIEEYLVDLNGKRAAMRAGYSPRTAAAIGCHNLRRPAIRDAIAARMAERSRRLAITADRVLEELAKIAFANLMDYMRPGVDGELVVDFSRLSRDEAAALIEVRVEDFKDGRGKQARLVRRIRFKLADKRAALVDIGRHLGMFVDKVEVRRNPIDEMSPGALRVLEGFLATVIDGTTEDDGGDPGAAGAVPD